MFSFPPVTDALASCNFGFSFAKRKGLRHRFGLLDLALLLEPEQHDNFGQNQQDYDVQECRSAKPEVCGQEEDCQNGHYNVDEFYFHIITIIPRLGFSESISHLNPEPRGDCRAHTGVNCKDNAFVLDAKNYSRALYR